MSRTYRFRKGKFIPWWADDSHKEWEYIGKNEEIDPSWEIEYSYGISSRKLTGKDLKRVKSLQYRDRTFRCKEPGPHWFRNLFTDRPQRRESKRQLQKFLLDSEFEVILNSKDPLEYWI